MTTQTASSRHFQRKISDFCEVRIAPLVSRRALDNVKPYLASLIIYRKPPPMRTGRFDWQSISAACGLETEMTAELRRNLQAGLEAIIRWVEKIRAEDEDLPIPSRTDSQVGE
jgi:hypothetical protein